MMIRWARFHKGGYEVSTKGDKRFSALVAKLKDGRTIEEAYQLDVKGYRELGDNWRLGKGKPPLKPIDDLYSYYRGLWHVWASENPILLQELILKAAAHDFYLTDCFASTEISQARALAEICNEYCDLQKRDFLERFTQSPGGYIAAKAWLEKNGIPTKRESEPTMDGRVTIDLANHLFSVIERIPF